VCGNVSRGELVTTVGRVEQSIKLGVFQAGGGEAFLILDLAVLALAQVLFVHPTAAPEAHPPTKVNGDAGIIGVGLLPTVDDVRVEIAYAIIAVADVT
jgi:hypothetical protein